MTSLRTRVAVLSVAMAAAGTALPATAAIAHPARVAVTGYGGFHSDGSGIPSNWKAAGAPAADRPTATPSSAGYLGFVDGRIPASWRAAEPGPAAADTTPAPPPARTTPATQAPDTAPVVLDDGTDTLPWVLGGIVAILAAALAAAVTIVRRGGPARIAA